MVRFLKVEGGLRYGRSDTVGLRSAFILALSAAISASALLNGPSPYAYCG